MKTILSFIATSWLLLEVLYTITERYHWNLALFDIVLCILILIGLFLLGKKFIGNRIKLANQSLKKILLVDDEKLIRRLISEKTEGERQFIISHEAANGIEALRILKNHEFDMVITDIDMPEMNGLELCKIVKKDYPKTKVLALTMFSGTDKLTSIIKSGASGYLNKDMIQMEIKNAILSILHGGCYFSDDILVLFKSIFAKNKKTKLL